eukprot:scaffold210025_cov27-Tisochrysis_lutea.AAC.2
MAAHAVGDHATTARATRAAPCLDRHGDHRSDAPPSMSAEKVPGCQDSMFAAISRILVHISAISASGALLPSVESPLPLIPERGPSDGVIGASFDDVEIGRGATVVAEDPGDEYC